MLQEVKDLGFEYAELSHGIRISLLPGIIDAVDAGLIKISSLHNFCPLPIGVNFAAPNIFKFSSPDARERENAYRYTLKTLDTAVRVKAPLVVLHLGNIDMKGYTDRLIEWAEKGLCGTPKYERLCEEINEKRERKKEKSVALVVEMVRRLAEQAEVRHLTLGVENREQVEEIPLDQDFPFFFKEFVSPAVAYWHDTGHAQIKENLGFINHNLHLETLADRLAGFHIHDVDFPAHDHLPPGQGTLDFAALKAYVKPEHLKVFELGPHVPVEQLRQGVNYLQSIWGNE